MPLAKMIHLANGGKIGLWKQTEDPAELEALYTFEEEEKKAFFSLHLAKRRGEWLALRHCLMAVLKEAGYPYQAVHKSLENKPFVPGATYELSFSHCDAYAAVYWHPGIPVGVDVERHDRHVGRLAPKFLSREELELFSDNEAQLMAWSFKESLYKVFSRKQLDFKKHLRIERVDGAYLGHIHKASSHEVHKLECLRYEDCILTFNID